MSVKIVKNQSLTLTVKKTKKEHMKKSTKKRFEICRRNDSRHMVVTPIGRVSFPQLFEARAFEDDPKKEKYFQTDLIFDEEDDFKKPYKGKKKQTVSMKRAVLNAKIDQWGEDREDWPEFRNKTFKDGNDRKDSQSDEVLKGYEDKVFITARSGEKFQPRVVNSAGEPVEEDEVYGGCYARAHLLARPYAVGDNFGVRFILLALMKTDDGEKFGGTSDAFDYEESGNDWDTDEDEDDE